MKINDSLIKFEYSTEERPTHKIWIDGKRIYRKVYTFTTSSNNVTSWTEFDRSPENIENVINIYGTSTDKSNHVHPINYYESSNNYIFVMLYSNNSLRYQKKVMLYLI